MKKHFVILLTALACLALSGCGGSGASSSEPAMETYPNTGFQTLESYLGVEEDGAFEDGGREWSIGKDATEVADGAFYSYSIHGSQDIEEQAVVLEAFDPFDYAENAVYVHEQVDLADELTQWGKAIKDDVGYYVHQIHGWQDEYGNVLFLHYSHDGSGCKYDIAIHYAQ